MIARAEPYYRRVGAVRPSHLMFTGGVGALIDLPNFSILVRGLDDWKTDVPGAAALAEPRLLKAVQRLLGPSVAALRPAPWMSGLDREPTGPASRVGVPTRPFPSWMRCTACDQLAPLDAQVFGFENSKPRKPQDARFFHTNCTRKRSGKKPLTVAARFVLSCTAGHLDDFPYVNFVHKGLDCEKVSHPTLKMDDRGGNMGANVEILCVSCGERRNIRDSMGRRGQENLPRCRARHPHLMTFDPDGCDREPKVLVVGASNQWFPQTLSALDVPRTDASQLQTKVEKYWATMEDVPGVMMLPYIRKNVPEFREFKKWSDQQIWDAIEAHRRVMEDDRPDTGYPDLRTPEWEIFSASQEPEPNDDFTLRRDPDGVPAQLKEVYADVAQVERLREVRALIGFTRLDAPDPDDPDLVTRAPLARTSPPDWVPASEVRGEGIFLRVPEQLLSDWEARVENSEAMREHRAAYGRFRENRYSDRIQGPFDAMRGWPTERFIALHTLSHLLIRTIALECGYSSASLSERIYAGNEDDRRSGILIYTAVPDADGTLGGLVSLAEPERLVRLTRRALTDALHCSSDPLCAERLPQSPADFLHGAACHVCLFVSETTCERGNRFLDRRFVVPIDDPELALFPRLP